MKKVICIAMSLCFLMGVVGCNKLADSQGNGQDSDITDTKGQNDGPSSCLYYITDSSAGIPPAVNPTSHLIMDRLLPCKGIIQYQVSGENTLDLYIDYGFTSFYQGFFIQIENVPYSVLADSSLAVDASGLTGICKSSDLSAEQTVNYSDISVKGVLGEGAQLSLEGMIHPYPYPFALHIASATTSEEAFSPQMSGSVCIDCGDCWVIDFQNDTEAQLVFTYCQGTDLTPTLTKTLAAGEAVTVVTYRDSSYRGSIILEYPEGEPVVFSLGQTDNMDGLQRISSERDWTPGVVGAGDIQSFYFNYESYSIGKK